MKRRTIHLFRFLAMGKSKTNKNFTVQHTNDSSILSKNSMIKQGYFKDDYLQFFAAKNVRRAPLINRGYYIRMKAVEHVMRTFLTSPKWANESKQIVSLGAGFDTSFFRFHKEGLLSNTTFFEVDFQEVVAEKFTLIKNNEKLSTEVGESQPVNNQQLKTYGLKSQKYCLFSCDLKDILKLENCLLQFGIDKSHPTLLLSEVVLAYLDPTCSTGVIKWAAEFFTSALFVTYEQVYPQDAFGLVMLKHFKSINSPLRSIETYPDPKAQVQRYKEKGWSEVLCCDMNQFYFDVLGQQEKSRIERLEPFDEFEEWQLKCAHYVIVTAVKGSCERLKDELFPKVHSRLCLCGPSETLHCKIAANSVGTSFQRYGHSACYTPDGKTAIIYGGFGLTGTKHMRLGDILLLHQRQGQWVSSKAVVEDPGCVIGPRMFHTATLLSDGSVFIYGGRTSPTSPCTSCLILRVEILERPGQSVNNREDTFTLKEFSQMNMESEAIWNRRHAAQKETKLNTENALVTFLNDETSFETENETRKDSKTFEISTTKRLANVNFETNSLLLVPDCEETTSPESSCGRCDTLSNLANETLESNARGGSVSRQQKVEENVGYGSNCCGDPIKTRCHQQNEVTDKEYKIRCATWNPGGDRPSPRWRHTSTSVILNSDKESLLVFGGCSLHSEPLGDCYSLDVASQTWKQVQLVQQDGLDAEPRHSHSASRWGDDVVLVGGLGKNLVPLPKIEVLRTQIMPMELETLNVEPPLEPRYSHTAHVIGDTLVLLGGVTPSCPGPPSLVTLDLNSLRWQSFNLPFCCQPSSPILLHNHCSICVGPQSIMVLGGGGNCFSFGTSLNKEPVVIELPLS